MKTWPALILLTLSSLFVLAFSGVCWLVYAARGFTVARSLIAGSVMLILAGTLIAGVIVVAAIAVRVLRREGSEGLFP